MAQVLDSKDSSWWVFTLPAFLGTQPFINMADAWLMFSLLFAFLSLGLLSYLFSSGGIAWKNGRNKRGSVSIPGPRGLPFIGSLLTLSRGLPHRTLSAMAASRAAKPLMALSLGSTPLVITSDPKIAKQILNSPSFADRPPMQSAKQLLFERSLGFAPNGAYWRLLRRIASSHLFSPKMITAQEPGRRLDCATLLAAVADEQSAYGYVGLRKHLQGAALNNIMGSVFGKRFDLVNPNNEVQELKEMVEEGFELLGAFNWSDFLPWLRFLYDPLRINQRCSALVPRVRALVKGIIEEHKLGSSGKASGNSDFVDVLLSLQGEEKLEEEDMIAILWEMIFRGTDTTALLAEWILAELVLNPKVQAKLQNELDSVVGTHRTVTDADMASLPYLQAVVNETLRVHPPGPLLSWARLSSSDVQLSNGMLVPANTTAMVNMWSITHDPSVWVDPFDFKPERFLESQGGHNVDVRGNDLRLAPFGAGRRVCPGRNLGLVTVSLWVARLVHHFKWVPATEKPVDLREYLKLSCGMANPLFAVVIPRAVPF